MLRSRPPPPAARARHNHRCRFAARALGRWQLTGRTGRDQVQVGRERLGRASTLHATIRVGFRVLQDPVKRTRTRLCPAHWRPADLSRL